MLWCETGPTAPQDFEDLGVLLSQLNHRDLPACIDTRSVPSGLSRNAQFDLAPYIADQPLQPDDGVVLVGAHRLSDARLVELRRLAGPRDRFCLGFGRFETRQAMVAARAKLSYIFGRDPVLVDLAAGGGGRALQGGACPVFGVGRLRTPTARPRLLVVGPDLQNPGQAAALVSLALSRRFRAAVLVDGKSKQDWIAANGTDIAVFHYGEILPADLAGRVDICVTFQPVQNSYRLQCLVANLAVSGAALLDGTRGHPLAADTGAFISGPLDLTGLTQFLTAEILPNLAEIAATVQTSRFASFWEGDAVALFRELPAADGEPAKPTSRAPRPQAADGPARVVFLPTNGVGLGHAQRCTLVAAEFDRRRVEPVFATFPSCVGLVQRYGFDAMPLISRSPLHLQAHENDIANYLRLRALAEGAQTLVFDGGYVFDSAYRTIIEAGLTGVWIRRGLWQSHQNNTVALDREKAFARVIVPLEAFDELNAAYSRGDHLREVGPIVQDMPLSADRRRDLRDRLAERYGRSFARLVVTQLGSGVAADRGGQIQALCGMMERRADVLHLVVVWPTSVLQPSWFGWSGSRVVKTHHASVLSGAADLVISAAGYNSFHEVLYGALPSIFMPQMGSFMDDQRARARAAQDRELAAVIEPHELMRLEREIARLLDDGEGEAFRARLSAFALPKTGNSDAAALIEELMHGSKALERAPVAHRPTGRR